MTHSDQRRRWFREHAGYFRFIRQVAGMSLLGAMAHEEHPHPHKAIKPFMPCPLLFASSAEKFQTQPGEGEV